MADELRRTRCECCDEVLEEVLSLRQSFEKFLHRFSKQIVELRREVRTVIAEKTENDKSMASQQREAVGHPSASRSGKRRAQSRSSSAESPPCKQRSHELDEEELFKDEDESYCSLSRQDIRRSKQSKSELHAIKTEPSNNTRIISRSSKRPVLEFFGIHMRVMPTCPFKNDADFEEWESLLVNDEDQRDHLRVELMQGHFDDAEKYVKHIWSSLLSDEAAECYSYRGNLKTAKKAIKNYTFTAIFKECFLQRYEQHDAFFFLGRTMRFFNYAHDRLRRISKAQIKYEKTSDEAQDDLDEQAVDDSLANDSIEDEEDDVDEQM